MAKNTPQASRRPPPSERRVPADRRTSHAGRPKAYRAAPPQQGLSRDRIYWIGIASVLALATGFLLFLALSQRGTGTGTGMAGGTGGGAVDNRDHISVQHILIGFKDAVGFGGNPPPKAAERSQEEARQLAYDLLNRAKAGEDFDKLVSEYTDDSAPGIYGMANTGVQPNPGEAPREGMVAAFGNVGFELNVGEIGIADYDPQTSPYGYHIIKRVK